MNSPGLSGHPGNACSGTQTFVAYLELCLSLKPQIFLYLGINLAFTSVLVKTAIEIQLGDPSATQAAGMTEISSSDTSAQMVFLHWLASAIYIIPISDDC